jgi:uncharacterized protein YfaS (alpha-2-macroglobulin family)
MVHNTTDAPVAAKVTVAGQTREITVPAKDRVRVGVPVNADKVGTHKILLSLEAFGSVRDRVEVPLRVEEPGIEEHPQLSGVFGEKQEIALAIPEDATFDDDAHLTVKTGTALYPELGQRLAYLLDYPHGCVEQTTSSTLPLIAAKTLIPWTGTSPLPDAELKKRIEAGITRLSTMQTTGGGLAYWPGGSEPNTFGSAYALRAILRAKEMGIVKPGLVEGLTKYLATRLPYETDKNLRVSIAEVLARSSALDASSADALYDAREDLDAFGLASAAIAPSTRTALRRSRTTRATITIGDPRTGIAHRRSSRSCVCVRPHRSCARSRRASRRSSRRTRRRRRHGLSSRSQTTSAIARRRARWTSRSSSKAAYSTRTSDSAARTRRSTSRSAISPARR